MNPQIRMAFLAWLTTPLIAGMTAQAQPTNTVWTELGGGVNGPVIAVLEGNGDTLVVVGDFTVAGGVPANHVALWDGNSFSGMGSGVGGNISSAAMVNGVPYIGGDALSSNYNDIAYWDGNAWVFGNAFSGNYPQVTTLFEHDGTLYAGGITAGFAGLDDHVLRLVNGNWEPVGGTLNNLVRCLGWHDGRIVAGGDFTALQNGGGTNLNHVAIITGSDWGPLGVGLPDAVNALQDMDGTLYAGGPIRTGGVQDFGLARFALGASTWEMLMPGSTAYVPMGAPDYPAVNALCTDGDHLILGGKFPLDVNGVTGSHVARFDGSADAFTPLASFNDAVSVLAWTSPWGLVAGGSFTMEGSTVANHLAHTDQATSINTTERAVGPFIFPNPVVGQLLLSGVPPMDGVVEVYGLDGRRLSATAHLHTGQATLDVSSLAPGLYLLRLTVNGQPESLRFIKE